MPETDETTMEEDLTSIACSEEEKEQLRVLAASTTAGIWRIKRAKVILGTLAGKSVERLVLETRVPPRSIVKCWRDFAQQRMHYFDTPERTPTSREASVERILAFLEKPAAHGDPAWDLLKHRYIGIHFNARQIRIIRDMIASNPDASRTTLAREVCIRFRLLQSSGRPKSATLVDILRRMDMDNLITLPKRERKGRSLAKARVTFDGPVPEQRLLRPDEIGALQFVPVTTSEDASLWNRLIHEHHYIKTFKLFGHRLRYLVYGRLSSNQNERGSAPAGGTRSSLPATDQDDPLEDPSQNGLLVAALGYATSAWRVSSRDAFIGWTDEQRMANLRYVVSNARFLILPWIRCHNLASRILGGAARRLPGDWEARYHYRPVLLETFVQLDRFAGTCYKAANWIQLGTTSGYSLYDTAAKKRVPTKALFVYPLSRRFREILCRESP